MRVRLTSGSPTELQESAPPYLPQDCRGIPGIGQKGREGVLVLASWGGILERMAGEPAASKINLRAPGGSHRAGDGDGVAAAFVAGGEGGSFPQNTRIPRPSSCRIIRYHRGC